MLLAVRAEYAGAAIALVAAFVFDVIDGPAGIVRATFQGFQLRHCINQSATCTLTGTIETNGTGVFE